MDRDSEILNAIRHNDNQRVLQQLYEIVLPKVKNYVTRNNGSIDDANDVFQEAVIALFRTVKTGQFNPKYSVDGFVYSVARNHWINLAKKNGRVVHFEAETQYVDQAENPFESLATNERKNLIQQTLNQLGEQCKKLLKLAIYDGMKPAEIKQELGLSSDEVARTNLYRCRKKLTALIQQHRHLFDPKS